MARAVVGTLGFTVRLGSGLVRYGDRVLRGIPAIMAASEERLFTDAKANTVVDTGHMRDHLLKTSDIVPVETEYQVFWRAQEFIGQVNPRGIIIKEFYPATLLFSERFKATHDPLTPATEAERPKLVRDLAAHFQRSSR